MSSLVLLILVLIFGLVLSSLLLVKRFRKSIWSQILCFITSISIALIICLYFSEFKLTQNSNIKLFELVSYIAAINTFIISIFLFLSFIYVFLILINSSFLFFSLRKLHSKNWIKSLVINFLILLITLFVILLIYLLKPRAFDSIYMHNSARNLLFEHANFSSNINKILEYITSFYKLIEKRQTSIIILFSYLISIFIGYIFYKLNLKKAYFCIKNSSLNISKLPISLIYYSIYLSIIELCLKSFTAFFWRLFCLVIAFVVLVITLKIATLVLRKKTKREKETNKQIDNYCAISLYKNTILLTLTIGFLMLCNWSNEIQVFSKWYIYISFIISILLTSYIYLNKHFESSLLRYGQIDSVISITNGPTTISLGLIFSLFEGIITRYLIQIFKNK